MKRRQREAIVAAIDQRMAERGSWCGETHLQKAVYFLQTLLDVPTDFGYILYNSVRFRGSFVPSWRRCAPTAF